MGRLGRLLVAKAMIDVAAERREREMEERQRQQHMGQAYAPPQVLPAQQYTGFSTPPPSPPRYSDTVATTRPSTPPAQGRQYTPTYSPNSPSPSISRTPSSAGRGRKKAVLIGCTYPGTREALRGPANDVLCMQYLLVNRFGFPPGNIVVLRDDDMSRGRDFMPFRDVIIRACYWLVADAKPGDSLFFHYSGHGSRARDPTFMEEYDGTILPLDHKHAGQIRDTELARVMVHPLPYGVVLHALFDSCHSGTMLDLPYDAKVDRTGRITNWRRSNMRGTAGGTVLQFAACEDKYTAADTSKLSSVAYTGAATYAFIESIERWGVQQSYGVLLSHMTGTLKGLGKSSMRPPSGPGARLGGALPLVGAIAFGPVGLVAGGLAAGGLNAARMSEQTPMLCCDKPLDLYNTPLMV